LEDGTGSFLTFQSYNDAGVLGDWALVNGGLISRVAGNEQGDLDLIIYVDGKASGFGLAGNMQAFGGPPAGLIPVTDGQMNIGAPGFRVNEVHAKALAIETVGKQIQINGTWQWVDCIPVQTQQGMRYIPTFAAHEERLV
jgi:hypothetical protein